MNNPIESEQQQTSQAEKNDSTQEKSSLVTNYTRESSMYLSLILLVMTLALTVSSLLVLRLYTTKPSPQYIATDNGQFFRLPSLNEPSLSQAMINNWVSHAALQTHTFDFNNVNDTISESKTYFTPLGYNNYLQAMAFFRDDILKDQLVVSCVLREAPVIQKEFINLDRYTWLVEVPVLLTYSSASVSAKRENRRLTLVLQRVDPSDSPYGIAIAGFRSERI